MKAFISLTFVGAVLTLAACEPRYGDRPGTYTETRTEERARAAETTEDRQEARQDQLKMQRDQIINDLYAQYGGGKAAQKSDSEIVTTLDRAAFQQRCESVGKGNIEQETAPDREEQFFMQSDVVAKCRQVHQLNEQIEKAD